MYEDETAPVVDHYRERDVLVEVSGEGTPDDVFDRLVSQIES